MSNWVRVSSADTGTILEWCRKTNTTYTMHNPVINPSTFEADYEWQIEDDKERTIFLLKWS